MSESLNTVRVDGCEARPKAEQATASAEAGRQRGSVDPRWPNHPDAKPQARTCSEPRCSIVIISRSDAVSGDVEPLTLRRRHHPSLLSAVTAESLGVARQACGEGCSGEGGRPSIVLGGSEWPDSWLQMIRHIWSRQTISIFEVRSAISATREGRPNAVLGVRGDDSSCEVPVIGIETKRPHFDGVAGAGTGSPSRRSA